MTKLQTAAWVATGVVIGALGVGAVKTAQAQTTAASAWTVVSAAGSVSWRLNTRTGDLHYCSLVNVDPSGIKDPFADLIPKGDNNPSGFLGTRRVLCVKADVVK